jgi:hypothetical protein
VRQASTLIDGRITRLRDVWQAAEWWQSRDYSEEQFKDALVKFRGELEPAKR